MNELRFKKVLIKISGGALSNKNKGSLDIDNINYIVGEISKLKELGVEISIVVGGGNILRGSIAEKMGIERVEADMIGMMGTIVNALTISAYLKSKCNYRVRVMSAINVYEVAEPYIRLRAKKHLSKGNIVIMAGGIGQPFITTDYPSVQRAIEVGSEVVLVAKDGVDGVYTSDPNIDPLSKRYKTLDYKEYLDKQLEVMDPSAIILAEQNNVPLYIFDFKQEDAMKKICLGENIGTLMSESQKVCFY